MLKKYVLVILGVCLFLMPTWSFAKMGSGKMSAKSKDIDVQFFGSLKSYPTFMSNIDFNDKATKKDRILDENGWMADHSVRNEFRIGWKGTGENWDFLAILESDFTMNKANGDRGVGNSGPAGSGMSGNSFGVEKLNFGYNFGPFKLNTGWNTKFLDIHSGGILYGDDHPYIGLEGKIGSAKWEALYLMIQDDIGTKSNGAFDGDNLDWRAYTLRVAFDVQGLTLAPMFAFSDNNDHSAQVGYFGVEGYGKIGIVIPRFEIVYADGTMDKDATVNKDYDIQAWGAYGSVELDLGTKIHPYLGAYYLSGDDDPNDSDMEAFNGITNISRYTPTFGMENALIYRYIPSLGSHLYSNNFATLGTHQGYGGISNSSKGDGPGMIMYGAGAKGSINEKLSYKTQLMYFQLAEEDALGIKDDEMGLEFDLQLTYKFSNHFSIGNVIAIFDPGDAVKDLNGHGYTDTAYLDTVELKWNF